jgi:hypothetical protein
MMWLTWRQFRAQAIVSGCVLLALAIALLVTGFGLAHLYTASGLPGCHPQAACQRLAGDFTSQLNGSAYRFVFYLGTVLTYVAPALIGAFWGAPLVARELETGTFRLAWNQSISRRRWLLIKVGLVGLVAMAIGGLLSLMVGWWAEPIYRLTGIATGRNSQSFSRLEPLLFGAHGIAPIGYAAFAFTLGVTAGLLIKRTIPAMAVTLAGFVFVQVAWPAWIRPRLLTPLHSTFPLTPSAIDGLEITNNSQMIIMGAVDKPGAWILSDQTVNSAGHVFSGPPTRACLSGGIQACNNSIGALHLNQLITYQPGSRFWAFQWYETGIFIVLAVALAWFCSMWISRRRLA